MFLTKKHLSRRAVLKGTGAAIALPLLDAMIPAGTAFASTAAAIKPRLGFVYYPHGAVQKYWTPKGTGKNFEFSPILKPIEPMRDYVTVISGLRNKPAESSNPHGIIEQTWLTCQNPQGSNWGPDTGMSIDQIAAREIGQDTPLPSIELCGEPGGATNFRKRGQALPLEGNPRKVFFTMFGAGRFQRRSHGAPAGHRQPARLRAGCHQEPQPHAGHIRPRTGQRLPGFGA